VATRNQRSLVGAFAALCCCARSPVLGARAAGARRRCGGRGEEEGGSSTPAPPASAGVTTCAGSRSRAASFMLLAVSNHITRTSPPFRFCGSAAGVVLLSFIFCFDHDGCIGRACISRFSSWRCRMGWLLDSLDLKVAIPAYLAGCSCVHVLPR